jgi:hypothetical protein
LVLEVHGRLEKTFPGVIMKNALRLLTVASCGLFAGCGIASLSMVNRLRTPAYVLVGSLPEEAALAARVELQADSVPLRDKRTSSEGRSVESYTFDPREIWASNLDSRISCGGKDPIIIETSDKLWFEITAAARPYTPQDDPMGSTASDMRRAFRSTVVTLIGRGRVSGKRSGGCELNPTYAQSVLDRIAGRLPPPHRVADTK